MYGGAYEIATQTTSFDGVKRAKAENYLKIESDILLNKHASDPEKALEEFSEQLLLKISESKVKYDKEAIRYFLIQGLHHCYVFPNPNE